MFRITGQCFIVIILLLLIIGITVFSIMNPNETNTEAIKTESTEQITPEAVEKANKQYKGYSDYIVTPKKANYTIQEIYSKEGKVFIKLLDSEIFNTSKNDSTYGLALGNTLSALMSDFFPSGITIVIECGDNIVFTGNIL